MKTLPIILFVALVMVVCSFNTTNKRKFSLKTIVIDAGHGGKDIGCHGKKTKEAHIALTVAMEVGERIKSKLPGTKVIFTRDKDEFIELHDRAGLANKNNADFFISIHCNSAPSHIYGSETYTMGLHTTEGNLEVAKRENAVILKEDDYLKNYNGFDPNSPMAHILFANYQNAHLTQSVKFASYVEDEFKEGMGRHSRGVKQAGFLVLWKTAMPSALIEIGYLTNEDEEKFLKSPENQEDIANSIVRALKKYKEDLETDN
ncbi:MAG: N-acetylmuramoyl-L-alanine amidase [Bacteroidota bacterium]|nr:N-acetylmuramoyl-L-alanine amidase [Bacteroidota bacterium]